MGCSPPKGVKRGLLERSAAWNLQAKMFGGLSAEARRALKAAMRRVEAQIQIARMARSSHGDGTGSRVAFEGPEGVTDTTVSCAAAVVGAEAVPSADAVRPMRGPRRSAAVAALPVVLSPGARLLREWNGRQHFVDVVEEGYVFDGKTYRSLSAVAKRITGAHWSGPRFFGL